MLVLRIPLFFVRLFKMYKHGINALTILLAIFLSLTSAAPQPDPTRIERSSLWDDFFKQAHHVDHGGQSGSSAGSSAQAGSFAGGDGGHSQSQAESHAESYSTNFGAGPFSGGFSTSQSNSNSHAGGGNWLFGVV